MWLQSVQTICQQRLLDDHCSKWELVHSSPGVPNIILSLREPSIVPAIKRSGILVGFCNNLCHLLHASKIHIFL
ncbi:hypothetical protein M378DRAFT_1067544 [Amanita muscaria Koide BX008]|uniref:Uncharacterized protein n=1 Tax=Amanita muscaria (strain Koide BX008) TaxID=946122 RepID=A0A0C2WCZ9_AMAMK|nr:hypothetical protein M378DRAFT_1067544 [Amanita muscaria Koide BX008]